MWRGDDGQRRKAKKLVLHLQLAKEAIEVVCHLGLAGTVELRT